MRFLILPHLGLTVLFCLGEVFGLLQAVAQLVVYLPKLPVAFYLVPMVGFLLAITLLIAFLGAIASIAMIVGILLRRRWMLIPFWCYLALQFVSVAIMLIGGYSSFWENLPYLLGPLLWAFYFYSSEKFARAFFPYKPPRIPLRRKSPLDNPEQTAYNDQKISETDEQG